MRDYAIITVLFDTGLRVGELISMGLPDWKNHLVRIDWRIQIKADLGGE